MTADTLKSTPITNLDAVPAVPNTSGQGSPGHLRNLTAFVTPTAAGLADTTSTYKMVRLPSTAKLKSLKINLEAAIETSTGLALDVGAYYSDSTIDGTQASLQGTSISATAFGSTLVGLRSSAVTMDGMPGYKPSLRDKELWDGLGLASNPGGFIDIVIAVHTAATGAVSKQMGVSVEYVD